MSDGAIVIGAGLAGLAAAVRIASTGRAVTVLERNHEPGGCATTYRRGRFTFEASLHLLDAVGPGEPNRAVLEGLGIADRIALVRPEPLRREIWPELGVDLALPQGRSAVIETLVVQFPDDAEGLAGLFDLAARVHAVGYARLAGEAPPWGDARAAVELGGTSASTLLARYLGDPRARAVVGSQAHYVGTAADAIGAVSFLVLLHGYVGIGGWAVRGGSRSLTEALVGALESRGGQVLLGVDVERIDVVQRRVRAVVAADGRRWETRAVVAAIPPPVVFGRLLAPDVDPETRASLEGRRFAPSFARLSVGLGCELPGVVYETGVGGADGCAITVPTAVDRGWSPPGTAVATCTIPVPPSDVRWPTEVAEQVTDGLLGRLERYLWPGLRSAVEVTDLAQPATYARYLAAPHGSVLGWALGPGHRPLSAATGVAGLVLAGGWTFPGPGQTSAMISGWLAARELIVRPAPPVQGTRRP